MSLYNADKSLTIEHDTSDAGPVAVRRTHLPEGIAKDVGATYRHIVTMGTAAIRLAEAQLSGSATVMQFAAQEIAEMAHCAQMCAQRIERQLARHRRRNPLSGVRS